MAMKTPIVYIYTAPRIKLNPPRLGITSAANSAQRVLLHAYALFGHPMKERRKLRICQ
ncbi:hypothetical protein ALT1644_340005 [Alteromonas macleodii]